MKISEAMEILEGIAKQHGDIDIYYFDDYQGNEYPLQFIEYEEASSQHDSVTKVLEPIPHRVVVS